MSALPSWRFEKPLKAFANCGLDFAGPFELKAPGRGKAKPKIYLLLITCLQTRAVHLELTEAMTMSATLNAISRFVDIRGMPHSILSDNFSTFVSKDKELESWVRSIQTDDLIATTKANVCWKFIPPRGSVLAVIAGMKLQHFVWKKTQFNEVRTENQCYQITNKGVLNFCFTNETTLKSITDNDNIFVCIGSVPTNSIIQSVSKNM